MAAIPLAPATSCRHTSGAVLPTTHTSPRPVITTLRVKSLLAAFRVLLDVLDGILHGLDLFGVLVGNLQIECLFKLHYQLDHVERIGSQVLLEARARGNLRFVHLQLLDDDLFHLFFNGHASISSICFENWEKSPEPKNSAPLPTIPAHGREIQPPHAKRCAWPRSLKSTGQAE